MLFPRIEKSVWIAIMILALSACATNEIKIDDEKVSSVKKVAIGGFTLVQEAAIKNNIAVPKMPGGMNSSIPDHNTFAKVKPHGANAYILLSKLMKSKKGWKVYPYGKLTTNRAYRSYHDSLMEDWQNRRSPLKDFEMIFADKVLDYKSFFEMGQPQRDKLMNDLGVDALATFNIKVEVKSKYGTLNGFGDKKPVAKIEYILFKKGEKEPIWEVTMEPSEGLENVPSNMFTMDNKEDLLYEVSLNSIRHTFTSILDKKKVE